MFNNICSLGLAVGEVCGPVCGPTVLQQPCCSTDRCSAHPLVTAEFALGSRQKPLFKLAYPQRSGGWGKSSGPGMSSLHSSPLLKDKRGPAATPAAQSTPEHFPSSEVCLGMQ